MKTLSQKIAKPFAKFAALFSTSTLAIRTLICFFVWFAVSAMYYGLGSLASFDFLAIYFIRFCKNEYSVVQHSTETT